MPWNDQAGGGGNSRGPWGQGPTGGGSGGGGGGGGGQQPPDLEDLLKKGQDRFKNVMPSGSLGPLGILVLIGVGFVGWLATGFYTVDESEVGVVLRFGEPNRTETPGLKYHLPAPIEQVIKPEVQRTFDLDIGQVSTDRRSGGRVPTEGSLMLTGDENIIDLGFTVQWQISDAEAFLFNVRDPQSTIRDVAISVMREVVGQSRFEDLSTGARARVADEVRATMQSTLDAYGAGVLIQSIQVQEADPPAAVIDAFLDVQRAAADRERTINEAEAYRNRIIPEARGEAERILQEAQAYREQTVAQASGEAERFIAIYTEYRKAPEVTRRRLFLETMEQVFGRTNKIIIDEDQTGGSGGVVPYLPLNELQRNRPRPAPDTNSVPTQ